MGNKNANKTEKTPIFKKWWFWAIVVLVLIIGVGSSSTKTDTNNGSGNDSPSVSSECPDDEKIEIIDLSSMGANDIAKWARDNSLNYKVGDASYSDTITQGAMVSQSINPGEEVCKGTTLTVTYSLGKEPTMSQKNALTKAKSYSDNMHMSKSKIYDQLTSEYGEGFTAGEAQYAIDNLPD